MAYGTFYGAAENATGRFEVVMMNSGDVPATREALDAAGIHRLEGIFGDFAIAVATEDWERVGKIIEGPVVTISRTGVESRE